MGQLTTYIGQPLAIAGYQTLAVEQWDGGAGEWVAKAGLPKNSPLNLFYFSTLSLNNTCYVFGMWQQAKFVT